MAEAYGTLTFTKSEDAQFDVSALVKHLNQHSWDNWGGEWIENEGDGFDIYYSCRQAQYPTVFPEYDSEYFIKGPNTNETYSKAANQISAEEEENIWDIVSEDVPLTLLAQEISPLSKQGWIELACSSNEKQRFVECGVSRIFSSGNANRRLFRSGPCVETLDSSESI